MVLSRLAQVTVEVHEAGRDHAPGHLDHACAVGASQALAHRGDTSVHNEHVGHPVEATHRVNHAAAGQH